MRRAPAPLVSLLLVSFVLGLAWAVVLPPFEGPDEVAHFSYTQRIAEQGSITWSAITGLQQGDGQLASNEVRTAVGLSGVAATHANSVMRPFSTELDERVWERADDALTDYDRGNTGHTSAFRNPPLYYLYTTPPYLATSGGTVFTRLFTARVFTVLLLPVTVLFTWLLAGELLGRRRWLQTLAAGSAALVPQATFLAGNANPDMAVAALWSATLYLAVATLHRGATRARLLGLVLLAAAGALTHGRAIPLVVVAGLTFAVLAWRRWVPERHRRPAYAAGLLAASAAAFGAALTWYAVKGELASGRAREFASYVWQFYLPRPDFMQPNSGDEYDVRRVFVDRFFSELAQFELTLPTGIVDLLATAAVVGLVLLLVTLVVRRRSLRREAGPAVVLAGGVIALLGVLHAEAWRSLAEGGGAVITGRYLLALLPLFGVAIALVARELPRAVGPAVATALLSCGVLMNLSLFGAAIVRWYV